MKAEVEEVEAIDSEHEAEARAEALLEAERELGDRYEDSHSRVDIDLANGPRVVRKAASTAFSPFRRGWSWLAGGWGSQWC